MSFDVVSLYMCIPIKEVIEVINCLTNPDTTHLVEISLTSTFFSSKVNSMNIPVGWPWAHPYHQLLLMFLWKTLNPGPQPRHDSCPRFGKNLFTTLMLSSLMARRSWITFSNISTINPPILSSPWSKNLMVVCLSWMFSF